METIWRVIGSRYCFSAFLCVSLYDSASNPRLACRCICPVANLLERPPFISCFIGGNRHPTIPYRFKDDRRIGHASAEMQRDQATVAGSTR